MQLDSEIIRTLINFFGSIALPVASAIYTWIATRDKDNAKHIKAVEEVLHKQIARLTSRQDQTEAVMKHLPRSEEIAALKGDIRALQAESQASLRETKDTRAAVNRIEDYLLRK
ncbi:hypothetical protein [Burkholderia gladioli]|uniref:hypothetical protein n=1 Tax=Burkholderia gladioli TaxID=28095 RepID=UPI003015DCA4